jgi:hypothetical protein
MVTAFPSEGRYYCSPDFIDERTEVQNVKDSLKVMGWPLE